MQTVLPLCLLFTSAFAVINGSVLLASDNGIRGTDPPYCQTKGCTFTTQNGNAFPIGDPRNCYLQDNTLVRMEVLPGTGWDNLRNLDMGMVVWKNYSQCLTSEDGKYLIPDNTFVVALKESRVELTSEYFDHWNNYTSTTSTTVNAEAHASIFGAGLGGKFSSEYQSVKKSQYENKAVTTRVQLRHKLYTVRSQPDMQLHPNFKSRLLDISAHLQSNNTKVARYLADLIVRDFGTHYITSIDAGAIISKVDHVKSSYAKKDDMDKSKITASASASFPFGGVSVSTTHTASHEDIDLYQKSVAASHIKSYGGPPYRANFTTDKWEDGLLDNLVAIDRSGDPLHFVVTPQSLPELPEMLTIHLSEFLEQSIESYYKHNAIKGCTNPNSKDFNFQAILDDHSCEKPYNNFTFGGVFQTCKVLGSHDAVCVANYLQKNPKTNDYSCPTGYESVLVHKRNTPSKCHRVCRRFLFFSWDCHNECGYAEYSTYWCAATGQLQPNHGYLFGGLYNKLMVNPVTGTANCPPKFYPQNFGPENMYVCISDDYELASQYSIPFAGFFSCSTGNPLALKKNTALEIQLHSDGPRSWPKACPQTYTQHLAVVDENCEINYCVKANSLSDHGLAIVRRPPFLSFPKMNRNITIPLTLINDDTGKIWFKSPNNQKWIMATKSTVIKHLADEVTDTTTHNIHGRAIYNLKAAMDRLTPAEKKEAGMSKASSSKSDSSPPVSNGTAVGITIGVIAVLLVIVLMVFNQIPTKEKAKRF